MVTNGMAGVRLGCHGGNRGGLGFARVGLGLGWCAFSSLPSEACTAIASSTYLGSAISCRRSRSAARTHVENGALNGAWVVGEGQQTGGT